MQKLCNIIWNLLGGMVFALAYFIIGAVLSVTVVLMPIGRPFLRLAKITFSPFGKFVDVCFSAHPLPNALWMIPIGLSLSLVSFVIGAVLCVTLIGIPFGKQCFKVAKLRFAPFGSVVE